jgi:hypothetical protein
MTTLAACFLAPRDCDMSAHPAIRLDVRDSVTEATVTEGIRAIARDGTFADTTLFRPVQLAHERPGTYTVTVEKEGYQTWSRTGVRVRDGECHVRTVDLIARLKR